MATKKPAPKKPAPKKPAPNTAAVKKSKPAPKPAPTKKAPAKTTPAKPAPKAPAKTAKPAPKPVPPAKSAPTKTKNVPAKTAAAKAPLPVKPVPKSNKASPVPAKKMPDLPNLKKAGKTPEKASSKSAKKSSDTPLPPTLAEAKEKHLQRVGKHTPAIFKSLRKGNTPVFFTLEDVREHLKVRKATGDTPATVLTAKPGTVPAAPKKAAKAVDLNNIKIAPKVVGVASLEDILGFNPAKETAASHDESKIPQAWRKYYRLLMDLRDHVSYGLTNLSNETLKRGANEDAGDTSAYGQHLGDAGSETFDRDFALNMLSNEQEAMNEIDGALDRIFKGTYGICEITHQAIPADRLNAVPFTRFTIAGQKEHELRKRRREQRGNLFVEAEEPAAEPVEEI